MDWISLTAVLDARTRCEYACVHVVSEADVRGVSTRRVGGPVEAPGISSSSMSEVPQLAEAVTPSASSAPFAEQHNERVMLRRYMSLENLNEVRMWIIKI